MIAQLVHAYDDEPPYSQVTQEGARWVVTGVTCVVDGRRVDEPCVSHHPSRATAQRAAVDLLRANREALKALAGSTPG